MNHKRFPCFMWLKTIYKSKWKQKSKIHKSDQGGWVRKREHMDICEYKTECKSAKYMARKNTHINFID